MPETIRDEAFVSNQATSMSVLTLSHGHLLSPKICW